MLSFSAAYVELCQTHIIIDIYARRDCVGEKVQRSSGHFPQPQVFNTSTLSIHFVNDVTSSTCFHFELLFSFHRLGEVPEQLPDGKWNCAVKYLGEFEYHLPSGRDFDCAPIPQNIFKDLVMFDITNLSDCFLSHRRVSIWAHEGHIVLNESSSSSDIAARKWLCVIEVNVVEDKVVLFDIVVNDCSGALIWSLVDPRYNLSLLGAKMSRPWYTLPPCGGQVQSSTFSRGNRVQLYLWLFPANTSRHFHFHFKAALPRPELEVIYHPSLQSGYVQTPGWDGVVSYPTEMKSCVTVRIPNRHVVMLSKVSVTSGQSTGDYYSLKFSRRENTDADICYSDISVRTIHDKAFVSTGFEPFFVSVTSLAVSFHSDPVPNKFSYPFETGFRILFSFHNFSSLPQRLSRTQWNCSVPYYSDFQQHFRCSLAVNCAGGEDEWFCPESFDACGLKQFSHLPRCYKLVGEEGCQSQGQPAIMNSIEEWNLLHPFSILHPLHETGTAIAPRQVYIGLSAANGLPAM
ncbi:hypothetical protein BaRGS_00040287 [Batillaria attramentaria]|uniref:CUB domain-containing protein n=1 Tax=Batillaria attramentaria TaxID=370345 RepID=A0ABD0J1E8_9CAEN